MRALVLLLTATIVGMGMLTSPVQAQPMKHTWVASNGDNTFTCERSQPCATFAGAFAKTIAGGEISCADSGNFGGLGPITTSLTVNCGSYLTFVGNQSNFKIQLPNPSDRVTLTGLDFDLGGQNFGNNDGLVMFTGAGTLILDKVKINNIGGAHNGILFTPNGTANLVVTDSRITNIGTSSIGAGITIKPASGVSANVTIDRTLIANNRFGIIADGSAGGTIRGRVSDSSVAGNVNNGITVSTTGSNVVLTVDNTKISGNNFGLVATGNNAGMLVRHSVINGNNTGLNTGSGGVLLSYGDNSVNANSAGETFTGPVGLK